MENMEEPTYEFVSPNDRNSHVVDKATKLVLTSFTWDGYYMLWLCGVYYPGYGTQTHKYLTLDACKAAYAEYAKPRTSCITLEQLSTKKESWWPF